MLPDCSLVERIETLQTQHRAILLGPLAPLTREATWDRGYPLDVRIRPVTAADLEAAVDAPLWRMVRSLTVDPHPITLREPLTALLTAPAIEGLDRLFGQVPAATLLAFAEGPTRPLTQLSIRGDGIARHTFPDVVRRVLSGPGLTRLRRLTLGKPVRAGDLDGLPGARELTDLEVQAPPEALADWLPILQALGDLRELRMMSMLGGTLFLLERAPSGVLRLRVRNRLRRMTVWRRNLPAPQAIAAILDSLPAGCLQAVAISVGGARDPESAEDSALERSILRVTGRDLR